jgi:hypothetical protein
MFILGIFMANCQLIMGTFLYGGFNAVRIMILVRC